MKHQTEPVARKQDILTQEIAGETLIYDLLDDRAFCLNETSSKIWHLCDGTKSIGEIAASLSKQTKSPVSEDFVWLAINQFMKDELLENNDIEIQDPQGVSRREIIRKVGFASVIALPLVSSMIVPTAVAAQSCLNPNLPCVTRVPPLCCQPCSGDNGSTGDPGICD